jgi:hypothetical protein
MQVYIAIYSHPYGIDVQAFRTMESAKAWQTEIALDYWSDRFDDDPPDDKEAASNQYWGHAADQFGRDESFEIQPCNLID